MSGILPVAPSVTQNSHFSAASLPSIFTARPEARTRKRDERLAYPQSQHPPRLMEAVHVATFVELQLKTQDVRSKFVIPTVACGGGTRG
jgi:hypothetical protein